MSYRVLVAALAAALLATGCSGTSTGGGGGEVKGKVFRSAFVTEQGKPRALVEGTNIELRFTDDGRLLASAGCNQMQGPVSLDGGKIAVPDLGMTAMGCPSPELHTQDEWLSKLLRASPSWRMDGTNLVVTGSNAEIVLGPEAPATLEGGTWKLASLIQADSVSSTPAGVEATIKFENGKLDAKTGCNDAFGTYKVDGSTITFELGHTEKSCEPDKMAVEKVVLETLKGQVTYKIDRNNLTLTTTKGDGIGLSK
ncbi:META domain-containing protein [Lentzea rhizosphaerae]|uniref:META domain-containing protein n=1 Tax=Lentzea rhizosphaerae TaxID=2041025 RepID=A0ABV8BPC1_9PSEU